MGSLIDKIRGRTKKAAGDLADDARLRREGRTEERKGEAKEELDRLNAEADAKAQEVAALERQGARTRAANRSGGTNRSGGANRSRAPSRPAR